MTNTVFTEGARVAPLQIGLAQITAWAELLRHMGGLGIPRTQSVQASDIAGIRAIVAHAKDEKAAGFIDILSLFPRLQTPYICTCL